MDLHCNYLYFEKKSFFNDLERINPKTFKPDQQDYLNAQRKTVGISHTFFTCLGGVFDVVDTAGQRSERFKWDHAFEKVSLILYVIPLNSYDQSSDDKVTLNRMTDIERVFTEIVNTKQLENVPIFLILNKCDLLNQKLKKKSFKKNYPKYEGIGEFDDVLSFFEDKFLKCSKFYSSERIFVLPSIGVNQKIAQQTLNSMIKIFNLYNAKKDSIKPMYQEHRELLMKMVSEELK
jgi:GTPase SAR1 family protein